MKRMRKKGHRYKSEASVLATISNQTLDAPKTGLIYNPCRLITNTTSDKTDNQHLNCPDEFQQEMAPSNRTHLGLTIAIPYYASPAMLLQQLANFASYPIEIQQQIAIIIVDDGSPPGLQAIEYIQNLNLSIVHLRFQIARVTTNINWNTEGSRNLAFYLADTQRGLMLDLDMLVPVETIQDALQWGLTAPSSNEPNATIVSVAHKFSVKKPNGDYSIHPALALLDVNEYWNAGGLDEDFAGEYGFGIETHFWFMWTKGPRVVEEHKNSFLIELDTEPCNFEWLQSSELIWKCKMAIAKLPTLNRNKRRNRRLWNEKSKGEIPRSTTYLRFFWTMDMR
jgi:ferredoxin-thioredoxin reductase catalytic subunit